MRIYAIFAHPKKDSLNGRIFYDTVNHLRQQGATVDVLDLYDYVADMPFYAPKNHETLQDIKQHAFFHDNKERFMAADRLFIVYPIYWFAVPGVLKCWLDSITNYAWQFNKGPYALPLHSIKKALVVNSASMSNWFRWLRTRNSGTEMVKESLKFLGIRHYTFYEIGNTPSLTPAKINKHIAKICKKADWLIK